jgi:hypothetical protein
MTLFFEGILPWPLRFRRGGRPAVGERPAVLLLMIGPMGRRAGAGLSGAPAERQNRNITHTASDTSTKKIKKMEERERE